MKRALTRQTAICVTLFVLVIAGIAHAKQEPPPNPFIITDCTTITQPGSYTVANNIQANASNVKPVPGFTPGLNACIVIEADFVTLDLAGFALIGGNFGPIFASGIAVEDSVSHYGIYVHSGTVENFSVDGVDLFGNAQTVENIRAVHNAGDGIDAFSNPRFSGNTDGHRIVRNTAISNGGAGIGARCPAVILENVAAGNAIDINLLGNLTTCNRLENSPLP